MVQCISFDLHRSYKLVFERRAFKKAIHYTLCMKASVSNEHTVQTLHILCIAPSFLNADKFQHHCNPYIHILLCCDHIFHHPCNLCKKILFCCAYKLHYPCNPCKNTLFCCEHTQTSPYNLCIWPFLDHDCILMSLSIPCIDMLACRVGILFLFWDHYTLCNLAFSYHVDIFCDYHTLCNRTFPCHVHISCKPLEPWSSSSVFHHSPLSQQTASSSWRRAERRWAQRAWRAVVMWSGGLARVLFFIVTIKRRAVTQRKSDNWSDWSDCIYGQKRPYLQEQKIINSES
jgi:hypothetical protein